MAELRARHPSSPEESQMHEETQQKVLNYGPFAPQVGGRRLAIVFGECTFFLDLQMEQQQSQENNSNEMVVGAEVKNKETLEWEEALKHWVNR